MYTLYPTFIITGEQTWNLTIYWIFQSYYIRVLFLMHCNHIIKTSAQYWSLFECVFDLLQQVLVSSFVYNKSFYKILFIPGELDLHYWQTGDTHVFSTWLFMYLHITIACIMLLHLKRSTQPTLWQTNSCTDTVRCEQLTYYSWSLYAKCLSLKTSYYINDIKILVY